MIRKRTLVTLVAAPAMCLVAVGGAVLADSRDGALAAHMHEHWERISEIQAALIRGDLDAVREPARYLAEHPTPASLPGQWEEHVSAMREAAKAVTRAQDFSAAASGTALMGAACGDCHTAVAVDVEFEPGDPPDYGADAKSHMIRHQWAADRMWEGIIGPSEPAWASGIDALLEAPLTVQELHGENAGPDRVTQMARRIHQLAGNGMMATGGQEKAQIYGEFLANCADCHTAVGYGPGR
jgi:mono/diheme cytochrome c family protein